MSMYTIHTTESVFCRKTFNSRYDVEQEVEETKYLMEVSKLRLFSMASCTDPSKLFVCEDGIEPIDRLITDFRQELQDYKDNAIYLAQLEHLLSEWDDCHVEIVEDGRKITVAKSRPENTQPPYLDGDFVRTDKSEYEKEY